MERWQHTATLLPNGKVLVAGGSNLNNNALDSAELYDPANGTWTFTGTLNTGRNQHTATLLENGMVLIAAGINSNGYRSDSAELYDPASGTWTATGSLNRGRYLHTATLLTDGTVLVAAGSATDNYNWSASAGVLRPGNRHLDDHGQPQQRTLSSHSDLAD